MTDDLAIVGGGPAGLAMAIHAASRGLSAVVLEASPTLPDKACGEGLMPPGVVELEKLGVRSLLAPADASPFVGIRFVQEDGSSVEGRFARGNGLGVRRTALVAALATRASALGVRIELGAVVQATRPVPGGVRIDVEGRALEARMVVAADGLGSPLRRAAGLEGTPAHGRFALRRHLRLAPWTGFVENHLVAGAEAYVTPTGADRVNVCFQWNPRTLPGPHSYEAFLDRFPLLRARVRGADADSTVRGIGPLVRTSTGRVADRLALLGDAAGFIDGISGEGLTLAFRCAFALAEILPGALARGATARALAPYERTFRREYGRYAFLTRALLAIAARPRLRRALVGGLVRCPTLYQSLLRRAVAAAGESHGQRRTLREVRESPVAPSPRRLADERRVREVRRDRARHVG
jgi:flavin-dependent dehydrogenase